MKFSSNNYPIYVDQASSFEKEFRFGFDGTNYIIRSCAYDTTGSIKLLDFEVVIVTTSPKLQLKIKADTVDTVDLVSDGLWDMLMINAAGKHKFKVKGPMYVRRTFSRYVVSN